MAARIAIMGLLVFGAGASWSDWFTCGPDCQQTNLCATYPCPSGWVYNPRGSGSTTATKENCCQPLATANECQPTCEWQCSSPHCEQNCTTRCEEVDCPEPECVKQPCQIKCEKPTDCKWAIDDEVCAKTNCSFAKPICAKPQCEMVCPPPICGKTECKKRCGWDCKVNLNENGEPCCKAPECELVCESPRKCNEGNKPKTSTCGGADADPSWPVNKNYTCSPPHVATTLTTTVAPRFIKDKEDPCKPSCGWHCTSTKKYHQTCEKKCSKPAQCEIRCQKPPLEECTTTCKATDCGNTQASVPDCPMKDCPNATQSCTKSDCTTTCPPPKCATFCEASVCDWQCELPGNASKADVSCKIECNKPKDCWGN